MGKDRRVTIIIKAAHRTVANTLAHQLDPDGGDVFIVGLAAAGSPVGTAPTHYFTGWQLDDATLTLLQSRLGNDSLAKPGLVRLGDTDQVLTALGLAPIPSATLPDSPIGGG